MVQYLLGKTLVAPGSNTEGIILGDGDAMGWGFGKSDIPGNDGLKNPIFKVCRYLPYHILGQLGPLIVHGKENASNF
jgi:hypothetical protein